MGKLTFLYPGQGSQAVGMGAELRAAEPELFERYFRRADEVSGLPVRRYTLEGPREALTRTDVAQPALFSLSLALTEVAGSLGLRPDFVAGHSLGEYTAAVAAGGLGSEDGISLVSERGRLMQQIQSERPGAMAAIIGLSTEQVEELCGRASQTGGVAPANFNSPTQIVCSGAEDGVERLVELAREAGAKRAVRLGVGAAFHSELMKPVRSSLGEAMKTVAWSDPKVPLVANFSGRLIGDGEEIHQALLAQIASPVRWVDCVRTLVAGGSDTFLELGPGRVLSGLVKQIEPAVEVVAADCRGKLEQFVDGHPDFVDQRRQSDGSQV